MKEPLENGAVKVLHALQQQGYEAYLVGGCVRDKMLQRPVKDYDIATSARPEQVQKTFSRTIPTGLQHGTVTVIVDGFTYEVTTFRKEEGYEQYRRPSEVHYIDSLLEDLRRRDFTMNAMALDADGLLMDPFHGMEDLRLGVLRCVGVPDERFEEDALRMLRCIRFASEYGLQIEEQTWASLCSHAPLLKHIAMERVRMELERMIGGAAPHRAICLLIESGLLQQSKEPLRLAQLTHEKATTADLNPLMKIAAPAARWAAIYLTIAGDADSVEEDLKRLTFSKQQIKDIVWIVAASIYIVEQAVIYNKGADENCDSLERSWKLAALQYGTKSMWELHSLICLDSAAALLPSFPSGLLESLAANGADWLEELQITSLSELQLSGKDLLIHLNRKGGPWMSAVLQHLLEQTALGHIENQTEPLLEEAKRWVLYNEPA
ncbi:CCA tRNA nucleotidyltransferase [Paenibacillus rigui]|uniref:CCA tRNA nucleotidyltransferase n=1 Tax=Paenibacillus rigui TaxID=554312 RepID=A0A229UX35_9BACL|nr:CCA tRNA nucleotidyltransferase [Paenibacillus rigui]OXM88037.1 CCA tRNA nucleotidyltransferase [Paenibacillus rigui]